MKSKLIGSLFIIVTLVVGIVAFAPSAFAQSTASVTVKQGSSSQGCEKDESCFQPYEVKIDVGGTVTWTNTDTNTHTISSGKPSDDTYGSVFDTGISSFKAGKTFSHTFPDAGTFDYLCQLHPWMTGVVTVAAGGTTSGGTSGGEPTGGTTSGGMTMVQGMSTDGSTRVTIDTTPAAPVSGQPLSIALTFKDANGNPIDHQNYAITVTQDGNSVLSNTTGHTHTGSDMQMTNNLASVNPVDIQVTLNGVGLPGTDPSTWTGPKGDVVSFHVVPEFGSIAPIVLAIAVISIVAFTAKTRVIPKL